MRMIRAIVATIVIATLALSGCSYAQGDPSWTKPFPPFHIAGNLYYVGSKGLANYLIVTRQGNILINSDLETNVPMIKSSIEDLGFKFSDTKVLLISHAHWDHDAGSAMIKQATGATYMVMEKQIFSMAPSRLIFINRPKWIGCCMTVTRSNSVARCSWRTLRLATQKGAQPGR